MSVNPCLRLLAAHGLYVHSTSGRLRLELPSLVENPTLARQVEKALSSARGVLKATASAVTGRILVHYQERETGIPEITQILHQVRCLPDCLLGGVCRHEQGANGLLDMAAKTLFKTGMELALGLAL